MTATNMCYNFVGLKYSPPLGCQPMTQLLPNLVFYILIRQSTHQPLKFHNYELISDVCVLHDYMPI